MKALLAKFLQSKDTARLVLTKNPDGTVTIEEYAGTGGSTAATAPASDVAALVAALGVAA